MEPTDGERVRGKGATKGVEGMQTGAVEENEEGLTRACRATRRLVRAAFEVCRPGTTGRAVLEYVNRKESGTDRVSTKAFDGSRKPSSIKKYTEVWLKVLRYI
jgi:hypothetical protein